LFAARLPADPAKERGRVRTALEAREERRASTNQGDWEGLALFFYVWGMTSMVPAAVTSGLMCTE